MSARPSFMGASLAAAATLAAVAVIGGASVALMAKPKAPERAVPEPYAAKPITYAEIYGGARAAGMGAGAGGASK